VKAFLLGAGASVDAGLPTSVQLTKLIADKIDENFRWRGTSQILHAVIGALIRHDTAKDGSAFAGVDVERVFAAVTALADRESQDLAAFVERWDRSLDGFASETSGSAFWDRDLHRAIFGQQSRIGGNRTLHHGSQLDLKRAIESAVRSIVGDRLNSPDSGPLLERLRGGMLEALITILDVDPSQVGYLAPVVTTEDLAGVATLNYDLSLEYAAEAAGIPCDTGLDTWAGGYEWEWAEEQGLHLLKLHGSLDYLLSTAARGEDGNKYRVAGDALVKRSPSNEQGRAWGASPALVFGQGSKLRSDGPFLAMLVEFDRMLASAAWLTVIGYSFRDEHINAALARWVNGSRAERLTVIDLNADAWSAGNRDGPTFLTDLVRGQRNRDYPKVEGQPETPYLEIDWLNMTAAEGLGRVQRMFVGEDGPQEAGH
jgi:hypothetical protein